MSRTRAFEGNGRGDSRTHARFVGVSPLPLSQYQSWARSTEKRGYPRWPSSRRDSGLFPVERRILAGHPPNWRTFPRLILLLFGGIPNSPRFKENASGASVSAKVTEVLARWRG